MGTTIERKKKTNHFNWRPKSATWTSWKGLRQSFIEGFKWETKITNQYLQIPYIRYVGRETLFPDIFISLLMGPQRKMAKQLLIRDFDPANPFNFGALPFVLRTFFLAHYNELTPEAVLHRPNSESRPETNALRECNVPAQFISR